MGRRNKNIIRTFNLCSICGKILRPEIAWTHPAFPNKFFCIDHAKQINVGVIKRLKKRKIKITP